MRPLLLLSLLAIAACAREGDAPSTAGPYEDPSVAADSPVDRGVPDAPGTAGPEGPEASSSGEAASASGPVTYDCASGETITLDQTDGELRYTLDGQTVVLVEEGDGRFATEAMWVAYGPDGRVTVTRDEDSALDCTAR